MTTDEPTCPTPDKQKYVVLSVIPGEPGFMPTYARAIATDQSYESPEAAAKSGQLVRGYGEDGKRFVVVPADSWHEFEMRAVKDYEALPVT